MSRFLRSSLLLLILIAIFSCNKLDSTSIGADLIPGTDKLITDTLYLNVETVQSNLDSANLDTTSIRRNEAVCVGAINDEVFGQTTAAAYFQVLPGIFPFNFPVSRDSITLDSVVIAVTYAGAYGDTAAQSRVEVFRVSDPLFSSSKNYRLNEAPTFSFAGKLGEASFTSASLKAGYKLSYKGDTTFNQLRIRLDNALGNELLNENSETGAYKNDTTFRDFLNGFALIPDSSVSGNGVLHYFSLNVNTTNLQLFYHYKNRTGGNDTTVALFPFVSILSKTAIANKIHRTLLPSLNNSGEYANILTAPGVSANIHIKGLDTLQGKPYIIHRAELVATQTDDVAVSTIFTPPVTHLYALNASGQQTPIPFDSVFYFNRISFDAQRNLSLHTIAQDYCGGVPDYRIINNQRLATYRYNLTRYVQNIINGKAQPVSFKLAAPYYAEFAGNSASVTPLNAIAAGRVRLNGGTHLSRPMRMIVYYSRP